MQVHPPVETGVWHRKPAETRLPNGAIPGFAVRFDPRCHALNLNYTQIGGHRVSSPLLRRPLLLAQPLPGQADMVGLIARLFAVAPLLHGCGDSFGVLCNLWILLCQPEHRGQ